jgi:AbrB family looped-hinge helix DNA binding protein
MDVLAKLTSKGQVTVPRAVRQALDLHAGDQVLFRVHDRRAVIAKTPDFLDLAGSVPVPAELRGASWERIRQAERGAWRAAAAGRDAGTRR